PPRRGPYGSASASRIERSEQPAHPGALSGSQIGGRVVAGPLAWGDGRFASCLRLEEKSHGRPVASSDVGAVVGIRPRLSPGSDGARLQGRRRDQAAAVDGAPEPLDDGTRATAGRAGPS